jgi:hypothetical protein
MVMWVLLAVGCWPLVARCFRWHESYIIRVGYRFGFFGWYSVGISWFLPNRYRRNTRSVHFGIIILAGTPFFLERGVTAPLFRGQTPILRKKGFLAKPLRVPAKFFSAQNTDRNTYQPAPVYWYINTDTG